MSDGKYSYRLGETKHRGVSSYWQFQLALSPSLQTSRVIIFDIQICCLEAEKEMVFPQPFIKLEIIWPK
jgi:hypothetical protein